MFDRAARTFHRGIMPSTLPLIVLGHIYLLVPASDPILSGVSPTNSTSTPNIYQVSEPLPDAIRHRGYTYIAGIGAYKFHSQATDWNTARLTCREEGGSLAVINSQAESEVIAKLFTDAEPHLNSINPHYAWLGFHDLFGHKGRYETIHNEYLEDVGFNRWRNAGSDFGAYCGLAFENGLLDRDSCDLRYAFICEFSDINRYVELSKTNGLTVS